MIERYVNMGSTAGGNGTTNATVGANRAWASWSEAMAAFNNTDPGDEVLLTLTRGSGGVDTTGIFQPNVVTTAARPFRVQASEADFATATWSNAKYTLQVTDSHCFYNNVINYLQLSGIQFHLIETDSQEHEAVKLTNANQHATLVYNLIERCYVRCTRTAGNTLGIDMGGLDAAANTRYGLARNCVVEGFNQGCVGAGALSTFVNITAVRNNFGFIEQLDPQVMINCVASLSLSVDFVVTGAASCTNNASGDGTAPGPNSQTGATAFVDANANNYHLAEADTVCTDHGEADPLEGETGEFFDDMDGGIRTVPWSIGADQISVVPPESGIWSALSGLSGQTGGGDLDEMGG